MFFKLKYNIKTKKIDKIFLLIFKLFYLFFILNLNSAILYFQSVKETTVYLHLK